MMISDSGLLFLGQPVSTVHITKRVCSLHIHENSLRDQL